MIENIYHRALDQHPEFADIPKEELLHVIRNGLHDIEKLETAAHPQHAKAALTRDVAQNIAVLWDFSGPGVYDGQDRSDDRYTEFSRSRGMERARLHHTARIAKKIAELLSNKPQFNSPIGDIKANILKTKKMISQRGPKIIYNGTNPENDRVKNILHRDTIIIPQENVIIDDKNIQNTNDQIKTMILPEGLHQPGKEIGLISHAPHLRRIARVLNQSKNLPADMKVRLFPVATPQEGKEEYAAMEIMGLLYYAYLAKSAKLEAYPHIIHGEE